MKLAVLSAFLQRGYLCWLTGRTSCSRDCIWAGWLQNLNLWSWVYRMGQQWSTGRRHKGGGKPGTRATVWERNRYQAECWWATKQDEEEKLPTAFSNIVIIGDTSWLRDGSRKHFEIQREKTGREELHNYGSSWWDNRRQRVKRVGHSLVPVRRTQWREKEIEDTGKANPYW